jgi:hypothetical protein
MIQRQRFCHSWLHVCVTEFMAKFHEDMHSTRSRRWTRLSYFAESHHEEQGNSACSGLDVCWWRGAAHGPGGLGRRLAAVDAEGAALGDTPADSLRNMAEGVNPPQGLLPASAAC